MSNENDNALTDAFNADAYWGKAAASVEQQLADLLAEARKYSVDPFVRSICGQLFDHPQPETLVGWQAELLIEAVSELVYCARSQQEPHS
jgi:hypothetical protein